MRSRALPALGVSVVALALATSLAGTATAASPDVRVAHKGTAASIGGTDATCFTNLTGDTGVAITSQNFESAFDAYDSYGADDFKLRRKCLMQSIQVVGQYYNGTGPAVSETVTIYKNNAGVPGAVVKTKTVAGVDTGGSYDIPWATKIPRGKYFLGVQINMDFGVGGQWGWENTSTAKGGPAQWQNPGDGFATGCTTWANMQTCLAGTAPGPDFMFSITK